MSIGASLCTISLSLVNLCAYLSIFRTNPSAGDSHLHQFAQFAYIVCGILVFLISNSKQYVQSRGTCGILKIERGTQRLTDRACMGEASC